MNLITEQIDKIKNELERPDLNPQSRRHLVQELAELERNQINNPVADITPTSLQLYCHENPDALECRIYRF